MSKDNYPSLRAEHINDARLFADRKDLIASLTQAKRGVIAEVGVAHGEFSQFILSTLDPKKFVAFDTFGMHNYPSHWGVPSEIMFKGMTHLEFYKDRFSAYGEKVVTEQGMSHDTVARYPDSYFDLMYIDAGHSYEEASRDANLANQKTKIGGIIIFNDYIMVDHFNNDPYGVVQAVNEFVSENNFQVIGFALHHDMFCDIAIAKHK